MRRLLFFVISVVVLLAGSRPSEAQPFFSADTLLMDVQILAADSLEGRRPGTPGALKARAYLEGRLAALGLRPFGGAFAHPFTFTPRRGGDPLQGVNLIGWIPGTAATDSFIVVTAHYDHVGVRDGVIYNGADDNASGTAAALALARAVKARPLRHSLIVALVDAEEMGLQGARAFVAQPPVPLERVRMNVNMDMVSRSEKGELYAVGTYHYPFLKPALEPVAAASAVRLLFGHDRPEQGQDDWTGASDHAAFHRAGIPFVYFGVEDHPGYHQPTDDADAITPAFFVEAVETIRQALYALDAAAAGFPARPFANE